MFAGIVMAIVTRPPRLVTNPWSPASLTCESTRAPIALSTSPPCSASWWSADVGRAAQRPDAVDARGRTPAGRSWRPARAAARVATGTATRATMLFFAMRRDVGGPEQVHKRVVSGPRFCLSEEYPLGHGCRATVEPGGSDVGLARPPPTKTTSSTGSSARRWSARRLRSTRRPFAVRATRVSGRRTTINSAGSSAASRAPDPPRRSTHLPDAPDEGTMTNVTAPSEPPMTGWVFPDPMEADEDIVAVGADLEPGTVLAAYRAGLFPMPMTEVEGMSWWSPVRRGILPLEGFRVTRSMRQSAKRFDVTVDRRSTTSWRGCADPDRPGGWIDRATSPRPTAVLTSSAGRTRSRSGGTAAGRRAVRRGDRRVVRRRVDVLRRARRVEGRADAAGGAARRR